MLHPNIYDMIMYCKSKNIRVVLFTSGVKRNNKMTDLEMKVLRHKIEKMYENYKEHSLEIFNKAVNHYMNVYEYYNNKEFSAISRDEMEMLKEIGLDKMVIKYDGTILPCPAFKEYDLTTLNMYGIRTSNIYDDLEHIQIRNGTRAYPLCKKLYDFDYSIK